MSSKLREALKKFSAVDLSMLKFPLDGDSSAIYNSDKEEITIPYWRVADLLNEVKVAQDMAKSALAEPMKNCEVGSAKDQSLRFYYFCFHHHACEKGCEGCPLLNCEPCCELAWAQMPYEKEVNNG
jgi:hypothetical protein